ncbi:hypothetical protein MRX96_004991 [Rhipicephalus microplus]
MTQPFRSDTPYYTARLALKRKRSAFTPMNVGRNSRLSAATGRRFSSKGGRRARNEGRHEGASNATTKTPARHADLFVGVPGRSSFLPAGRRGSQARHQSQ